MIQQLQLFFNRDRIIIIILSVIILSLLVHSTILFIELEVTKGCIGFMLDFISRVQPDMELEDGDPISIIGCSLYLENIVNDYQKWKESQN